MTDTTPVQYVRRLGVWDASMMVVGGIIGGGIFLNPPYVAQRTGSSSELILVWVVGGALALIGALCYGELGSRRPHAGGGYVYLREAYGPLIAFLYGWIMLLINYSGSIAAVATIFATYTCAAFGLPQALLKPLAVGAIVLLAGVNILGIRAGAYVQNVFTVLKLVALAMLIVTGLFLAQVGADAAPAETAAAASPTFWSFGAALVPVLFAYGGWGYVNNVAAEIRNPQHGLPRALIAGMVLAVAAYVLTNMAYLHALGHAGLAAATTPAASVMQPAFGDIGGKIIALGIAISTFGFCNISILSGARMFQVMGADGVFFRAAARLHPRFHTPDLALILLSGWAIVLALSGSFGQLLDYATLGDWIGYLLCVATLYYFRANTSNTDVFLAPAYPWLPAIFIIGVIGILVSYIGSNPVNAAIGTLLIASGAPVYWFWKRAANR